MAYHLGSTLETASRFLAGNMEADLIPTAFSSFLLSTFLLSLLFSLPVAAPSLDSIPTHLPASEALCAVDTAAGDALVSVPPTVPAIPCFQGVPSVSSGFWELPPANELSPLSSDMLVDLSYLSASLSSDFSPLRSPPPGGSTPSLYTSL